MTDAEIEAVARGGHKADGENRLWWHGMTGARLATEAALVCVCVGLAAWGFVASSEACRWSVSDDGAVRIETAHRVVTIMDGAVSTLYRR